MMQKLQEAYQRFDEANAKDPNTEEYNGKLFPKELLYAQRMTEILSEFLPDASEVLLLTTRCQHICRWEIPRSEYPMNRVGYLQWRTALKKFHVSKASEILKEVGYETGIIDRVSFLLQKKQLKRDAETQAIEDVICLVFLKYYYEDFIEKHDETKLISIIQKTWIKMSRKGQERALKLRFSEKGIKLINTALEQLDL